VFAKEDDVGLSERMKLGYFGDFGGIWVYEERRLRWNTLRGD
jgi:hypothetical protein